MKTEVYSWRVSTDVKSNLEREARRRNVSLSAVLDMAARDWLIKTHSEISDEQEQARIKKEALQYVGTIEGDDPHRSENVSQKVREVLRRRYGR